MKKIFFGSMVFISGFISVFTLVVLSVFKPWSYNGVEGFYGFLLGTDTKFWFVFNCGLMGCGLVICLKDIYQKYKKMVFLTVYFKVKKVINHV